MPRRFRARPHAVHERIHQKIYLYQGRRLRIVPVSTLLFYKEQASLTIVEEGGYKVTSFWNLKPFF